MQYLLKIRVSDIIIFIDTLVNYKTMPKTKEQFEQIRQERINTIMESALKLFINSTPSGELISSGE